MAFARGRLVLHRDTHQGRIAFVHPARVVSDDERGLLLWLARDSVVAVETTADGRGPRDMTFAQWVTTERAPTLTTWRGPGVLRFFPVGANHSVWFFRDDEGVFTEYYVNLEESAVRWDDGTLAGIDVIDQDLDIVARRDGTWRWKDEDEFAERLALPEHYWVPDEAAVWAEGRSVIKKIEAAEFPFDGTWIDFRPDPSWTAVAALPDGWDRPVVSRR
jgi:predicted RNA-binding protein associated with RNAse of E/G family